MQLSSTIGFCLKIGLEQATNVAKAAQAREVSSTGDSEDTTLNKIKQYNEAKHSGAFTTGGLDCDGLVSFKMTQPKAMIYRF